MEKLQEQQSLKLRMYFFVPYNISPIQQAIQAGHAALKYVRRFSTDFVWNFIDFHQTWVILNGGTTNFDEDMEGIPLGTINQIVTGLAQHDIDFSYFQEPDLNNALTAICFICDERVFNKTDYPDFIDYILDVKMFPESKANMDRQNIYELKKKTLEELEQLFPEYYKQWVRFVGGVKNVFLRELLRDKRLA
jgi:hypothetical protein